MRNKAEKPIKRERGRPKKATNVKSEYHPVLFRTSYFKAQPPTAESSLTEEQQRQRLAHYIDKIREICEEAVAAEYYWRLVFTATFHKYRGHKQETALQAGADKPPIVTPGDMATDAGMEYFNLKNLFVGRGTAKNLFSLLRFLHGQSIDFNEIQYNEGIVDRAYTFFTVLRQDDLDPGEVKQLFFK